MSMSSLEIDSQYNHLVKTLVFVLVKRLNKFYLKAFCDEKAFCDVLQKVIQKMQSLEQSGFIQVKLTELTTELLAILKLQRLNQDAVPPKPIVREKFMEARQVIKEYENEPLSPTRNNTSSENSLQRPLVRQQYNVKKANLYQHAKTAVFKPVIFSYSTKIAREKIGYQNKLKNRITVKKKKKYVVNHSVSNLSNQKSSQFYLYQQSRGSQSINNISFSDSSIQN